jgi:hypothetical protein
MRTSDRSVAAAIFANGTYFVDTPRIFLLISDGLCVAAA